MKRRERGIGRGRGRLEQRRGEKRRRTDRQIGEWFHTNTSEKSPQDGIVLPSGDVSN